MSVHYNIFFLLISFIHSFVRSRSAFLSFAKIDSPEMTTYRANRTRGAHTRYALVLHSAEWVHFHFAVDITPKPQIVESNIARNSICTWQYVCIYCVAMAVAI